MYGESMFSCRSRTFKTDMAAPLADHLATQSKKYFEEIFSFTTGSPDKGIDLAFLKW